MSRKAARESAFRLIFECGINDKSSDEILDVFLNECDYPDEDNIYESLSNKDKEYIKEVVHGTLSKLLEIDEIISDSLVDWEKDRVAKVNLAVMRLAVYEMFNREDIPIEVSINEAVEIAKKYQGDEAAPFINGALGAVAKKIQR